MNVRHPVPSAPAAGGLRTIQVVNVRWFNATAWYGIELARLLRASGHETLVIGLAGTASFEKAVSLGLDPVPLPLNTGNPLHWPGLYVSMRRLVQAFRPHVVNCHRGEGVPLWAVLRREAGFALVRTRGDQRLPKGNLPNRLLHSRVVDAVIATNSVMARHMADNMGVASDRVHTIIGGVDADRFRFDPAGRVAVRQGYRWGDDAFVIGLLGRFDRVKAQKETIEAVARLRSQGYHNLRLMLAGFETATTQAEVEGWIRDAGVGDITAITGRHPDVVGCISAMDAGVVPSLWSEAIARAALEIMACGVPLVSSTVGVMPDLLPGDAMCPPGDVQALAALLARVHDDASWREGLRAACVRRMASLRSEDFRDATLRVYNEALSRRQCPPRV